MKYKLTTSVALLGLAVALSSHADLLVYEGFDYPAGTFLDGAAGGTGFNAPWVDYSSGELLGAPPAPGGHRIEADSTSVGNNGLPNTWTGIPDGGYPNVGLFCLGERKDSNWGRRELDPAVVASFTSGSTTWMSFVSGHTNNGDEPDNHHKPNMAIGSGYLTTNRAQNATGPAIGGGARFNTQGLSATYWEDEDNTGTFEEHRSTLRVGRIGPGPAPQQFIVIKIEWDNVPIPAVDEVQLMDHVGAITLSDGTDTTSEFDPAGDPVIVKTRLETDITAIDNVTVAGTGTAVDPFVITFVGGQAGTDVPELVLGGTGTGFVTTDTEGSPAAAADTVSLANFDIRTDSGYTVPTEGDFDTNAVSITSAGPLEQSTFNTLSWHGSRTSVDEFRIGTTFDDLLSDPSTPAATFPLTITPAGSGYDLEWVSQAGMRYNVWSSANLSGEISTWTLVQGDITSTPDSNTYNVTPAETILFYAVEEYLAPPMILLSANFDDDDGGFGNSDKSGGTGSNWVHGDPDSLGEGGSITTGNGESLKCWGTDISNPGFYLAGTDVCLRSSVFTLGDVAATLSFAQALDIENAAGHSLVVNIIDDTSDDVIVAAVHTSTDGDINTADWKTVSNIEISGAALGQAVRIEWRFKGADDNDYLGAYIDDVLVTVPGS